MFVTTIPAPDTVDIVGAAQYGYPLELAAYRLNLAEAGRPLFKVAEWWP